jgi:hypothetical protein
VVNLEWRCVVLRRDSDHSVNLELKVEYALRRRNRRDGGPLLDQPVEAAGCLMGYRAVVQDP